MATSIGFIGLGLLGSAMVRRLIAQGNSVIGFDIDDEKINAAKASNPQGFSATQSCRELADQCHLILVCVTHTAALTEVMTGTDGILAAGRQPDRILIDHSTSDIEVTRQLARQAAQQSRIQFIDAPVSGGPGAALNGSLSIMAGGAQAAIETARPIMEQLGRFTHMGAVGAGQATKLVNQALVLPAYCVIAEARRLAQAYGIDASKVPHAPETGHAGSNLLPVLFDRMLKEDFTPTGYARQVLKDLEMLHNAAGSKKLTMPMSSQALTLFRMLVGQGDGELDGASVVNLLPKSKDD